MMQDASGEKAKETSEVKTGEINEGSRAPFQAVEKSQVFSNFGPDMSGSDDDEASEVDSFILDENDMEGSEEVLEPSKFLLTAETEEGQQQLQTVDPETHARLEALLEAAGISKLSSKDGKALTDPEVLRTLTSSVSSALDEATQAINCMRSEQQGQIQGAEGTQALSERDAGTVRKLYESGSVPDTTEEGESLLSLACSAGYYELAQVLLAMNANVEDRGIKGDCTPLMEAASGGFVDIVRLLILHGADVNAQSSAGNTPLHSAACAGHTNVVKELISHGASVEVHNENGHTPLMEAASAGHVEIAQQLLEAGAGINTHSNEFKESALTLACYKGHLEMVKYLLDAGADQEHKTDEMHTALMEASMDGHVEVARLLLDSGAHVNMPVDSFESPLTLAACGGHVELANLLIERGANIEEVNDEGYTPLMEAAREGHEEMVALLLSHGADINAQTEETQETALTLACCGGFQDVAEFLIKAGADIELGCSTPLMEAAQEGHLELVKFLLKTGSNVHAQTGTNDTALTYACENGHTDVAGELLAAGAFLEHESEGGRTPLMKAARAGHLCTVKFLISAGADVNRSTSTNDHTVLSLACAGGHHPVVECLLSSGADANHKLKDGSTMIIEAAKGGHTDVVKMLLEWPNRVMLNSSIDLAQPDMPHINMAQSTLEEPRVPVQGLAHIVPPNEPDSQLPTCLNLNASPGKTGERQNAGKILGKRTLPTSIGVDGKPIGKGNNTVIAENLQQISHEGAVLADLTDEKATEKVEAIINNIMAKELLGPTVGSKEEQLQRKQQILEELQKVERELQEKAQAQQQVEQQQQLLKARSGAASSSSSTPTTATPTAVRQAEETAKRVMELKAAAGATGVQRGLAESLCLTGGGPAMDSLVVQLPKLLNDPSLAAAATQSLIPNPAFSAASDSFLQSSSASPTSLPLPAPSSSSSSLTSPEASVAHQVQPPSPQFLQQPILSAVVANGNSAATPTSTTTTKTPKGRNNSSKILRSNKSPQLQPPLPPPPQQQQQQHGSPLPQQLAQPSSPQLAPLALNLQAEHNGGTQSQQQETLAQAPVHLSAETLQQQQLAVLSQQQQQHLPQLTFPQLTSQQQEQLLQHMLSQQVLQPSFQQPLQQLLPQVQQQNPQPPQVLIQQERAQLFHQTHQAQLLQQQLLKQTTTAAATAATAAAAPNPSAVVTPSLPADKTQQGNLFQSSLDVDSQTESNHDTALTLACAGGHSELVSLLLAKGANIEHRDKKGFTPLILGATAGHLDVVGILLDHQADIEAMSERTKDTPLSLACSGGRYEVVQRLLARGANKEHRNVSDYTPLSLAASGGFVTIIKLLLSHGAEINSRTGSKLGISPLMLAAMNGHTQAVKLLLDMGSDINAQIETNRNTALTLACFQGRHEVVSLLVDRKANIEHRAKTGLTPLMEAASGGYVEVGRVLLDKGADVNAPPVPSSRDTALTIAADKGHYRFVELLLHRSASVDVKNKKGNSPLWLACNGGHLDVVQLLESAGADIDSQDNRKVSCLMAAFRKGHIKVVKWMVKHVSQFPSDTELQRFISTVADKDLQKKCQQCMEIIVSAKVQQAAEATKNADSLLQEIDRERELDEQKRQIAAKRRERRKERKKKGKLEKSKDGKDKNSSPEPESETGTQDQDGDEDEDDDSVQPEPPSATVTTTIGTTLVINTDAKTSRISSNKVSSHVSFSTNSISTCSVSSSHAASASNEKRMHNAEIRKNRRNRKEKILEATYSSSKESYVPTPVSKSISLMTNTSGKVGLHSNTSSSSSTPEISGGSTSNTNIPNSNSNSSTTHSSANSKRKKNDIIKPVSTGRSRVGDLDDFGSLTTSKPLLPSKDIDRLSKHLDKVKINTSDNVNLTERDTILTPKLSPLGTSPRKGQRKDEGWKEVTRKSKKVTVPANVISRVIGRGGCNINSIRETSSAHVDIEKSQKGAVDRVITIKGSAEATRMAHAMITALVQEPEKDLSDIIARIKGKPAEKSQPPPATMGDFAIGTFSVPTSTNQASGGGQKSTSSKAGSNRQPLSSSSGATVNGRVTTTSNSGGGGGSTNVWQNPAPGPGAPSSPRRSPQKQLPQSLVQPSLSAPAVPLPSQEKSTASRQVPSGDQHHSGFGTPTTTSDSISFGTPVATSIKASPGPTPAIGRAGSELRQQQAGGPTSSSGGTAVGAGQKTAVTRPAVSVRVLQRQTPSTGGGSSGGSGNTAPRSEPQPLPIVSSHMPSSTNTSTTASSGITSTRNFFHLWNNTSPTPILSKKEDFASVAAAGVVPNQSSQQQQQQQQPSGQMTPDTPTTTPNDPTKAPGYKVGIRTASPHSRQQQQQQQDPAIIGSSLHYPPDHPDLHMMGFRPPLSSMPGIPPIHPGMPNPAGDSGHMSSSHMPYPGFPDQHPVGGGFPSPHPNFPLFGQPMMAGLGPLPNQKEEYSTPHQPMTLPEIKSTLNPNAPDFRITGPAGLMNGYPDMGGMRNGGDPVGGGGNGGGGRGGGGDVMGNNNTSNGGGVAPNPFGINSMLLFQQLGPAIMQQLMNSSNRSQALLEFLSQVQQQEQHHHQQRSASPGPPGGNPGHGPGGPPHLGGPHEGQGGGGGGQGMGLGPGPNPGSHSPMSNFMPPQGLPRNVSPMPGPQRPNSAPVIPDCPPNTPIRPSNIGSPMPPCTPPLSDGKQNLDDRRVLNLRPIGGERAAQRKLPLNASSPGLGGSGDFGKVPWGFSDRKDWLPATSPQMTAAPLPTSVMTSSVVTGGNMAYTLSQRENSAPAPGTEGIRGFQEPFTNSGIDPTVDPSAQNPQLMMQQMYSNGLNYNLPNMPNLFGSGGSGGGGEGGMAMWNHGIKAGPNEAGDSEAWRNNWSHTDM